MTEEIIVNLDNCAREPIHLSGAIQPHGLLFTLREPGLKIVQVSENVGLFLGISADSLLGQDLSSFLSPEQVEKIRFALASVDPRDNSPVELQLANKLEEGTLDGLVHRHDGFSFLELEPATVANGARFLNFYKIVSRLTGRLHAADSLSALFDEAARGIREMTGFDRVMLYRFADSYDGEVISEAKAEHADSFLGLWYPASDIPEQARKLYEVNPIRNIVDVGYTPVPIVPAINPDSSRPVDLSFAGLRSVSPIHCQYLKNMGVAASMSISILLAGKLWGLVACHHLSSKFVPYELRKACAFIGQVLSSEIARREVEEESRYQARAVITAATFLELLAGPSTPLLGLVRSSPNLLDLIPCEGAAVVEGDKADLLGTTPGYDELMELVGLLQGANLPSSFVTRSLKNHFPLTESMRATASGIIALEIARDPVTYVFFFRPEVAQTVVWAGNPEKPVTATEDGFLLRPRHSFAAWKEEVKGKALPWSQSEVRVANELRKLIAVLAYAMSRKLIEAHEQERTRIARELHDNVVQRLVLLSLELEGVQEDVPDVASELRTRIGALVNQTAEIVDDVQSLSHELHSSKLEYLGIVGAAKNFCKELGERQKLEIDFQSHDLPTTLPNELCVSLFRVLQEAVRNAAKHSGVKHFEVRLWGRTGEVHLTVSDLGAGFDTETAMKSTGLGLTSMQERLRLVGGELSINSQPKSGTTIHARVPFRSTSDSARAAG